jgi:uncharacterized protein (DUF302 family)
MPGRNETIRDMAFSPEDHSEVARTVGVLHDHRAPRAVIYDAYQFTATCTDRRPAMTEWVETQITSKVSPLPVADTVTRLTGLLSAKGMRIFAVIDQSAAASDAGLRLRATTLVIFGNPAGGTPVMEAAPLAALDLPLKALIWDDAGQTRVTYYDPAAIAARYGLSQELAVNLAGIDPLTDALVAP